MTTNIASKSLHKRSASNGLGRNELKLLLSEMYNTNSWWLGKSSQSNSRSGNNGLMLCLRLGCTFRRRKRLEPQRDQRKSIQLDSRGRMYCLDCLRTCLRGRGRAVHQSRCRMSP